MTTTDPKASVVIPVKNGEDFIGKWVQAVLKDMSFEVLLVDGDSDDGTDKIASGKDAKMIYQRNRGYSDALRTGFLYVRHNMGEKAVVMMDADSTYDPKDIPIPVGPLLSSEADMVGNRFPKLEKGAMTLTNKIGNKILS